MKLNKIGIAAIAILILIGIVNLFSYVTAKDVLAARVFYAGDVNFNTGYIMEVKYFKDETEARDYYSKLGVTDYNLLKKNIGSVKGVYDGISESIINGVGLVPGLDTSPDTKHVLFSKFNLLSNKTPDQKIDEFIKDNGLQKV